MAEYNKKSMTAPRKPLVPNDPIAPSSFPRTKISEGMTSRDEINALEMLRQRFLFEDNNVNPTPQSPKVTSVSTPAKTPQQQQQQDFSFLPDGVTQLDNGTFRYQEQEEDTQVFDPQSDVGALQSQLLYFQNMRKHAETLVDKLSPTADGQNENSNQAADINDLIEKKEALEKLQQQLSMMRAAQSRIAGGEKVYELDNLLAGEESFDDDVDDVDVIEASEENALADLLQKKAMLEKLNTQLTFLQTDLNNSPAPPTVSQIDQNALADVQQRRTALETIKSELQGLKKADQNINLTQTTAEDHEAKQQQLDTLANSLSQLTSSLPTSAEVLPQFGSVEQAQTYLHDLENKKKSLETLKDKLKQLTLAADGGDVPDGPLPNDLTRSQSRVNVGEPGDTLVEVVEYSPTDAPSTTNDDPDDGISEQDGEEALRQLAALRAKQQELAMLQDQLAMLKREQQTLRAQADDDDDAAANAKRNPVITLRGGGGKHVYDMDVQNDYSDHENGNSVDAHQIFEDDEDDVEDDDKENRDSNSNANANDGDDDQFDDNGAIDGNDEEVLAGLLDEKNQLLSMLQALTQINSQAGDQNDDMSDDNDDNDDGDDDDENIDDEKKMAELEHAQSVLSNLKAQLQQLKARSHMEDKADSVSNEDTSAAQAPLGNLLQDQLAMPKSPAESVQKRLYKLRGSAPPSRGKVAELMSQTSTHGSVEDEKDRQQIYDSEELAVASVVAHDGDTHQEQRAKNVGDATRGGRQTTSDAQRQTTSDAGLITRLRGLMGGMTNQQNIINRVQQLRGGPSPRKASLTGSSKNVGFSEDSFSFQDDASVSGSNLDFRHQLLDLRKQVAMLTDFVKRGPRDAELPSIAVQDIDTVSNLRAFSVDGIREESENGNADDDRSVDDVGDDVIYENENVSTTKNYSRAPSINITIDHGPVASDVQDVSMLRAYSDDQELDQNFKDVIDVVSNAREFSEYQDYDEDLGNNYDAGYLFQDPSKAGFAEALKHRDAVSMRRTYMGVTTVKPDVDVLSNVRAYSMRDGELDTTQDADVREFDTVSNARAFGGSHNISRASLYADDHNDGDTFTGTFDEDEDEDEEEAPLPLPKFTKAKGALDTLNTLLASERLGPPNKLVPDSIDESASEQWPGFDEPSTRATSTSSNPTKQAARGGSRGGYYVGPPPPIPVSTVRDRENSALQLKLATLYAESLPLEHREAFFKCFVPQMRNNDTTEAFQMAFENYMYKKSSSPEAYQDNHFDTDNVRSVPRGMTNESSPPWPMRSDGLNNLDPHDGFSVNADNEVFDPEAFDDAKDTIYREVAVFIAHNESRPNFLVNFFKLVQNLSSNFLRDEALRALGDVVSGQTDDGISTNNDNDFDQYTNDPFGGGFRGVKQLPNFRQGTFDANVTGSKPVLGRRYDYEEDAVSASDVATPVETEEDDDGVRKYPFGFDNSDNKWDYDDDDDDDDDDDAKWPDDDDDGFDGDENHNDAHRGLAMEFQSEIEGNKDVVMQLSSHLETLKDEFLSERLLGELVYLVVELAQSPIASNTTKNKGLATQLTSAVTKVLKQHLHKRISKCTQAILRNVSDILYDVMIFNKVIQQVDKSYEEEISELQASQTHLNEEVDFLQSQRQEDISKLLSEQLERLSKVQYLDAEEFDDQRDNELAAEMDFGSTDRSMIAVELTPAEARLNGGSEESSDDEGLFNTSTLEKNNDGNSGNTIEVTLDDIPDIAITKNIESDGSSV